MVEEFFKMLEDYKGDSIEDILNKMITSDDVQLKTEYPNPPAVTRMRIFGEWLRLNGLQEGWELVQIYIEEFSKNMVSYKRGSRKEIIQGVSGVIQNQLTQKDKLFGKKEGV